MSEMIQDREHQQELVCDLSTGATFNDLEWTLSDAAN